MAFPLIEAGDEQQQKQQQTPTTGAESANQPRPRPERFEAPIETSITPRHKHLSWPQAHSHYTSCRALPVWGHSYLIHNPKLQLLLLLPLTTTNNTTTATHYY